LICCLFVRACVCFSSSILSIGSNYSTSTLSTLIYPHSQSSSAAPAKDATRLKIEQMEAEREERRKAIQQRKLARKEQAQRNLQAGNPGDVDFIGLVQQWRQEHAHDASSHYNPNKDHKICICVRKRPMSDKERAKLDHDSVTCLHPHVWIHSAKFKVDGISKYLVHAPFQIDHAFDERESTATVYLHTTLPLLDYCLQGVGGRATVFCYGQTGSGKTHTMNGIQQILCKDLYAQMNCSSGSSSSSGNITTGTSSEVKVNASNTDVTLAFFELYGGFIQDLLHDRQRCKLLEDAQGEVNITGLQEFPANDPQSFWKLVEAGNK
jgi:kinesin family protein 2/24